MLHWALTTVLSLPRALIHFVRKDRRVHSWTILQYILSSQCRNTLRLTSLSNLRILFTLGTRLRSLLHHTPQGTALLVKDFHIPSYWIGNARYLSKASPKSLDYVILYAHGGGFCIGNAKMHLSTHLEWLAQIEKQTNLAGCIFSIEYDLAPECTFPKPIFQMKEAYEYLVNTLHISPSKIFLAGDSAGGNIAISSAVHIREAGLPMPAGMILVSPWVDLDSESESSLQNQDFDIVTPESLINWASLYMGKNPFVTGSPLFADLSDLPPMLIFAGGKEILLDDILEFDRMATRCGIYVDFVVISDMVHCWPLFREFSGDKLHQMATDMIARFVDTSLSKSPEKLAS
ncbi:alpha/beta-hydrolase [Basidiobolus meristosporus CBS 931.73]|uniref:Alpha/beta-hydrolase n=1 Tax=Basidiobolus meristosporus CBS 931.73 TaxID=1314790 RepID=A0A1Y1YMW4_9FUNG|nr:alpha/beta-hydrolase [Basidiobolus meristosporus CBS 931.73]|eukprot:ORX99380.1 alpha/beta-hydrolase [Basidiobolus meristosporus CBS 931.73]